MEIGISNDNTTIKCIDFYSDPTSWIDYIVIGSVIENSSVSTIQVVQASQVQQILWTKQINVINDTVTLQPQLVDCTVKSDYIYALTNSPMLIIKIQIKLPTPVANYTYFTQGTVNESYSVGLNARAANNYIHMIIRSKDSQNLHQMTLIGVDYSSLSSNTSHQSSVFNLNQYVNPPVVIGKSNNFMIYLGYNSPKTNGYVIRIQNISSSHSSYTQSYQFKPETNSSIYLPKTSVYTGQCLIMCYESSNKEKIFMQSIKSSSQQSKIYELSSTNSVKYQCEQIFYNQTDDTIMQFIQEVTAQNRLLLKMYTVNHIEVSGGEITMTLNNSVIIQNQTFTQWTPLLISQQTNNPSQFFIAKRNIKNSTTQSSIIISFNKDSYSVLDCLNSLATDANSSAKLNLTYQLNNYWTTNSISNGGAKNISYSSYSQVGTISEVSMREPTKNFEFPLGCNAIKMPKYLPYIQEIVYKEFATTITFTFGANFSMSTSCSSQNQYYYELEILESNVSNYVNHLSLYQGNPPSIIFNCQTISTTACALSAPSYNKLEDYYYFRIKLTMKDFTNQQDFQYLLSTFVLYTKTTKFPECLQKNLLGTELVIHDKFYQTGSGPQSIPFQAMGPFFQIEDNRCDKLIEYEAYILDQNSNPARLPYFILLQKDQNQFVINYPRTSSTLSIPIQTYKIYLKAYISQGGSAQVLQPFNLYIVDQLPACAEQSLIAPYIPNFYYGSYVSKPIYFEAFQISNFDCQNKYSSNIQYSASVIDQNYTSLGQKYDIGGLSISSSNGTNISLTFSFSYTGQSYYPPCEAARYMVRIESWVQVPFSLGSTTLYKILHNSVIFQIQVVCDSSFQSCANSLVFQGTNVNYLEDILYFDIQTESKGKSYTFPVTTNSQESLIKNCSGVDANKTTVLVDLFYKVKQVLPFITIDSQYKTLTIQRMPNQETSNWIYLSTYSNNKFPSSTVFRLKIDVYDSSKCKIKKMNAANYELFYQLMKPPIIFIFPTFKLYQQTCKFKNFNYNLTIGKPPIIPERQSLASLQAYLRQITVATANPHDFGIFDLYVTGFLNPYLVEHLVIKLYIGKSTAQNRYAPQFVEKIQMYHSIEYFSNYSYKLPNTMDKDGQEVQIIVNFQGTPQLPKFFRFDPASFTFQITPKPPDKTELYPIELNLIDIGHPIQRLRLEIIFLTVTQRRQIIVSNNGTTATQKIQYPDSLRLVRVDENFLVTLLSNNTHMFDQINSTSQVNPSFFKFHIIKAFTYEKIACDNFTFTKVGKGKGNLYVQINLNQTERMGISKYSEKDMLQMNLIPDEQIFKGIPSNPIDFKIVSVIDTPELNTMTQKQMGLLQGMQNLVQSSMTTFIFGNLALNLILTLSIQMLWGMINTLQLITLVSLFDISFPKTTQLLFKMISDISRFNIIPTDKILLKLLTFNQTYEPKVPASFQRNGYQSSNLIECLDSIFFYSVGLFSFSIVVAIVGKLTRKIKSRLGTFIQKVQNNLFFSVIIRFGLESYQEISIAVILNSYDLQFGASGNKLSSFLVVIFGFFQLMLLLCVLLLVLTSQDLKTLQNPTSLSQKRFGTYFDELRLKSSSKAVYLYHFWFMLRRFSLVAIAVFGNSSFQALSFWLASHLNLIYLIYSCPFQVPKVQRVEVFNELCTIAVGYGLLVLSAETNLMMKEFAGIWIVVVIATHFGVNLLIQLHGFVCNIKNNWRKIWTQIKCKKNIIEPKVEEVTPAALGEVSTTPVKIKGPAKLKKPKSQKVESKYFEAVEKPDITNRPYGMRWIDKIYEAQNVYKPSLHLQQQSFPNYTFQSQQVRYNDDYSEETKGI